jgi:hypothetical protein
MMKKFTHIASLLMVVLALATCQASGQQDEQAERFTPGEVIVKFSENSPASVRTRGFEEPTLDPSLLTYLQRLSEEIGIPVRASEVTAGGEVLLAIADEKLRESLTERLRSDPLVASMREVTPARRYILEKPQPEIVVGLKNSPDELTRENWEKQLEGDLGFSILGRTTEEGELAFAADLKALTLQLVQRLEPREDVEYAQTNALMQRQR